MKTPPRLAPLLVLVTCLGGCMALEYDLSTVGVPVSARPAPAGAAAEPFEASDKDVLWVHGLFGRSQPDVAALLGEAAAGASGVTDFRVSHGPSFHDWLITHLTLTLVRMKTVTVSGRLLRGG